MSKLLATDGEGERLDRFELVAELASGGMATVFLARLSGVAGFQRLVAIKRLHPHLANEADFIEMFLDEARLAARIHHPNVVPIQEVGESGKGYYLVMDYVEGDTFARLLARAAQTKGTIPWGVTIRVMLDTLAGLHAAHELKDDFGQPLQIVHRDVSPQNILVGSDGIARITDFGVARAASRLATTRSGQLKGKLAYMAPEQARGDDVDRRADLFSCGIVMWEALALKRLFKGSGEAQTLNRVLHDVIPPPSSVRPDIPAPLEEICMRALERDVDKRFATAADFSDELERVARGLSCVGSVRDVAACLETIFGNDLVVQRDAVRAWLARSEPSHPTRSRPNLPDSARTKVEGMQSEPPSSPRVSHTGPPLPADVAMAATAAEGTASSQPPENVSSVSSAVLGFGPTAPLAPVRPRSSARLAAIIIATGVVLGVGVWAGTTRLRGPPPTTAGPALTDTDAAIPSAASETATKPTPATTASAAPPAESATTTHPGTPGTVPAGIAKPGVKRPNVPARPGTVPTPTSVPDNLSKNPYR